MDEAPDDYVDWVAGHHTRLLRAAFLLTGNLPLAEDLVQEALIKVAQRWSTLRDGNPMAYARTIVHHDHVSWWRRRREVPVAAVADGVLPLDQDRTERQLMVARALDSLTAKQRAVVVLRWFEDLTERETAEILGVSIGTVKSQNAAALTRLRAHTELGELLGEEIS